MPTPLESSGLYGRQEEYESLAHLLARTEVGRTQLAFVEGEAGIGKSRLLSEILGEAEKRGFEVFLGRAQELEKTRPFGALADAFEIQGIPEDPLRAQIVGLLTPSASEESVHVSVTLDPGLQFQAAEAFVELVERLALEGPVVVAIEDLQWADPSTLLAFGQLVRRLSYVPLALLTTMRPSPHSPELGSTLALASGEDPLRVRLGPLPEDSVEDLVADTVGAKPGEALLAEVSGAGGNPLFVTELLGALDSEGAITISEGRADVEEVVLPPSLRLTILRRISFLSRETLEILHVASILGSTFSVADLSTLSGRGAVDLLSHLDEPVRAGVLAEHGELLRFRHDLIRDAIYEDIPQSARAALHSEAASRLAEAGAPDLEVAEHIIRGAAREDEAAAARLAAAAREASDRSPALAADLFEQAIAIGGPRSPARDRLLMERIVNMFWAGRIDEALAACREVLDRPHDRSVEGTLGSLLVKGLVDLGRSQEALIETQRALDSFSLSEEERASIMANGGVARALLGDFEGALEWFRTARATAEPLQDHVTVCLATAGEAGVCYLTGRFAEGVRVATEAMQTADESPGWVGHRSIAGVLYGMFLMEVDRIEDGITALRRGIKIAEEIGALNNLSNYQLGLITGTYLTGAWDDCIAEFDTRVNLAAEAGGGQGMVCNQGVRSMIALHRGDRRVAEAMATSAERELAETGPQYQFNWAMRARALLQESDGNRDGALQTLSNAWDLFAGMGIKSEIPLMGPDLVRLALAADDRRRAGDVASAVEDFASSEDAPWLRGAALRCRGLIEGDANTILGAVEAYRSSPRLLDRAQACEEAGTVLAREGKGTDGRDLLQEAVEIYVGLDALFDVSRIEAVLRGLGVRRGRRGARKREAHGWGSITETEARVVDLVVEGLTNRQIAERLFISPRTVETHLTHTFAKLGLSSRTELAAEAARRSTLSEENTG